MFEKAVDKMDEIKSQIDQELANHDLADDPYNRYHMMQGLLQAWLEDRAEEVNEAEKHEWLVAVMYAIIMTGDELFKK